MGVLKDSSDVINIAYKQHDDFAEIFLNMYEELQVCDLPLITNYYHYLLLLMENGLLYYSNDTTQFVNFDHVNLQYNLSIGIINSQYSFNDKNSDIYNMLRILHKIINSFGVNKNTLEFGRNNIKIMLNMKCQYTNKIIKKNAKERIKQLEKLIKYYKNSEITNHITQDNNSFNINKIISNIKYFFSCESHKKFTQYKIISDNCENNENSILFCQEKINKLNKLINILFINNVNNYDYDYENYYPYANMRKNTHKNNNLTNNNLTDNNLTNNNLTNNNLTDNNLTNNNLTDNNLTNNNLTDNNLTNNMVFKNNNLTDNLTNTNNINEVVPTIQIARIIDTDDIEDIEDYPIAYPYQNNS